MRRGCDLGGIWGTSWNSSQLKGMDSRVKFFASKDGSPGWKEFRIDRQTPWA